ncbi:MAG: hypothetical protein ABSB29_05735 [Nitrososphaerales archaeon]|jgi:hypothetical protein
MEPLAIAVGAFLRARAVAAEPFGSDSMTNLVDSAILIAAIGAAILAYGVSSFKSKSEASTESKP